MDEHRIQTILKKIRATHVKEDETFDFDIKPLVKIVEDIMSFTPKKDNIPQDIHGKKTFFEDINLGNKTSRDKLVVMINTFAWELERNCSSDEIKIDEIVLELFKKLSSYSWPGKAVISLSAFAINYGQFLLVEQLRATDPVAQSLALLEQLPNTMEKKKSDFETVTKMIDSILNLTTCFSESVDKILSHKHLQSNSPLLKDLRAQIQSCTYWIIRSILISQSQFANEYIELSSEVSTKLSDMVDKVSQMCKSLRGRMDSCLKEAEKNRQEKVYHNLKSTVDRLTKMVEKDNMSILKALIPDYENTDYQNMPLYHASSEKPVGIDSLTKKTVLLYFSDLKQCNVEFPVLLDVYNKPKLKLSDYEILWIPMVEKSSPEKDEKFHNIRKKMPWLSIRDLKLVDPAVIRFIREEWKSDRRSKIVVISHQGMLVSLEAIHMILIWGKSAKFPFSERYAEELWEKENWSVELLLNNIEVEPLAQWINEDKYVCLYGGEDLIFHEKILTASQQAKMPMKMLYMGTSNKSGIIKKNIDLISSKNLNIETIDSAKIQLFWTRIDCMWHSLVQAGKLDDEIMRWVLKMRSFDCSGRGWAIISKGSSKEMASGMGDTMLKCLSEYHLWESNVEKKGGFVPALKEHISSVGPIKSTTNTFSVPNIADGLSMKTECFECRKQMQRMTRFNCSGD